MVVRLYRVQDAGPDPSSRVRALAQRTATVRGDHRRWPSLGSPFGTRRGTGKFAGLGSKLAFEFYNDQYPEVDDTGLSSRRSINSTYPTATDASGHSPVDFGGWWECKAVTAALGLARGNLVNYPPTEDVTGPVLECIGQSGRRLAGDHPEIRFLRRQQQSDGSFFGAPGRKVYLWHRRRIARLASNPSRPRRQRALGWVADHHNADGGLAKVRPATASNPGGKGRELSVASDMGADGAQASSPPRPRPEDRIRRRYTGTRFPGDSCIDYQLYRNV